MPRRSSLGAIALLVAVSCLAGGVQGRPGAFPDDYFEEASVEAYTASIDEELSPSNFLLKNSHISDIPETATTVRVRSQLSGAGFIGRETDRACSNGERVYICPDLPCVIHSCPANYECTDIFCGGCGFQCKPIPPKPFVAFRSSLKPRRSPQPSVKPSLQYSAPVSSPQPQPQPSPPPPNQVPSQPAAQTPSQMPSLAAAQVAPSSLQPVIRLTIDTESPLCEPGYTWSKGLKRCTMCSPGYFSRTGARCTPCPEDEYAARSAASYCNECTGGSSTWGRTAQTGCLMTPNP
jgi:hypothetical protein